MYYIQQCCNQIQFDILTVKQCCVNELYSDKFSLPFEVDPLVVWVH